METGKNRFFSICEAYQGMLGKSDSIGRGARRYNAINESLEEYSAQNVIDMWCEAFKDKVCIIVGGYGFLCQGDGLYGILSTDFLNNSKNYGARWIEEELSAVKIFDSMSEAKSFLSEIPQMPDGKISEEWKQKYFPGTYIENVNEMKPIRVGAAIGGRYDVFYGESVDDDFDDNYDDFASPETNLARSDSEAAKARGEYYLIGYPYSDNNSPEFLFSSKSKDEAMAYAKEEFAEGYWDCINVCDPEGYIVKNFEDDGSIGESVGAEGTKRVSKEGIAPLIDQLYDKWASLKLASYSLFDGGEDRTGKYKETKAKADELREVLGALSKAREAFQMGDDARGVQCLGAAGYSLKESTSHRRPRGRKVCEAGMSIDDIMGMQSAKKGADDRMAAEEARRERERRDANRIASITIRDVWDDENGGHVEYEIRRADGSSSKEVDDWDDDSFEGMRKEMWRMGLRNVDDRDIYAALTRQSFSSSPYPIEWSMRYEKGDEKPEYWAPDDARWDDVRWQHGDSDANPFINRNITTVGESAGSARIMGNRRPESNPASDENDAGDEPDEIDGLNEQILKVKELLGWNPVGGISIVSGTFKPKYDYGYSEPFQPMSLEEFIKSATLTCTAESHDVVRASTITVGGEAYLADDDTFEELVKDPYLAADYPEYAMYEVVLSFDGRGTLSLVRLLNDSFYGHHLFGFRDVRGRNYVLSKILSSYPFLRDYVDDSDRKSIEFSLPPSMAMAIQGAADKRSQRQPTLQDEEWEERHSYGIFDKDTGRPNSKYNIDVRNAYKDRFGGGKDFVG